MLGSYENWQHLMKQDIKHYQVLMCNKKFRVEIYKVPYKLLVLN